MYVRTRLRIKANVGYKRELANTYRFAFQQSDTYSCNNTDITDRSTD